MAATNYHPQARRNMARALREGLGTRTDVVEAYAWLKLCANMRAGSAVGRVEMNELALNMDMEAIGRAEALAAEFRAGRWHTPVARVLAEGDPDLKLGGSTFRGKNSLAVINGKTLAEGESTAVPIKAGVLVIKCLKVEKDSVQIVIDGENSPRNLHLR